MVLPVSSNDFMSLRIQDQPPAPCSENLLETMVAMIGALSSSWLTVSRQKPAVVCSISHVTRVMPSFTLSGPNRKRYVCTSLRGGSASGNHDVDLGAMAFVAAAITAERIAPGGARVPHAIGAVVVAVGLLLVADAAWHG
jgi:hypothetical protein